MGIGKAQSKGYWRGYQNGEQEEKLIGELEDELAEAVEVLVEKELQ